MPSILIIDSFHYFILIKGLITDDVEVEDPTADPSYNLGENQAYQYLQPVLQPDSINQHIRKQPRPFRRQELDLSGALEPVTSALGPDAAVRINNIKEINFHHHLKLVK